MALHKTQAKSDLQKKLKLLEYQLYGQLDSQTSNFQSQNLSSIQPPTSSTDLLYLKQDLTKIALLAGFAVTVQLILYFSGLIKNIRFF